MRGNLGQDKTEAWLKQRVFGLGLYKIMERYCRECLECQKQSGYKPTKVPLVSMPQSVRLFERIALDIAGPFPRSNVGYHYALVVVDYPTRFPDAIP